MLQGTLPCRHASSIGSVLESHGHLAPAPDTVTQGVHGYILPRINALALPQLPANPQRSTRQLTHLPHTPPPIPQDKSTSISDRSTLSNLSAYLTLAHAKEKHGFVPAKFGKHV